MTTKQLRRYISLHVAAVFVLCAIIPTPAHAQTAPHRANFFLSWDISEQQARSLARWDLVVLDMEIAAKRPELIGLMRSINPSIKIFAYISAQEVHKNISDRNPNTPLRAHLADVLTSEHFLQRSTGERVSFWHSADMIDIAGPWQQTLPEFIRTHIFGTGAWDGIMLDNVWNGVTWYVGNDIDLDRNGIPDEPATANAAWNTAMQHLIAQIRTRNPSLLIIGNSNGNFSELDGTVYEQYHHKWDATVAIFVAKNDQAPITILHASPDNREKPNDTRAMRFGLSGALLTDSYFSFDFGDTKHESLWWYPEYNRKLGEPRGPAFMKNSLWMREFDGGAVIANPTTSTQHIIFSTPVETITKKIITRSAIQPRDAQIVWRRTCKTCRSKNLFAN